MIVKANIKNNYFFKQFNLRRLTIGEIIIHDNDLVESFTHIANASWNAPTKIVICKNKNRDWRVAKISWNRTQHHH